MSEKRMLLEVKMVDCAVGSLSSDQEEGDKYWTDNEDER